MRGVGEAVGTAGLAKKDKRRENKKRKRDLLAKSEGGQIMMRERK